MRKNSVQEFLCLADQKIYGTNNDFVLNNFIAEGLYSKHFCLEHQRINEIFCVSCQEEICTNCILFGNHKLHLYEKVYWNPKNEYNLLKNKLEEAGRKISRQIDQIYAEAKGSYLSLVEETKRLLEGISEQNLLRLTEN